MHFHDVLHWALTNGPVMAWGCGNAASWKQGRTKSKRAQTFRFKVKRPQGEWNARQIGRLWAWALWSMDTFRKAAHPARSQPECQLHLSTLCAITTSACSLSGNVLPRRQSLPNMGTSIRLWHSHGAADLPGFWTSIGLCLWGLSLGKRSIPFTCQKWEVLVAAISLVFYKTSHTPKTFHNSLASQARVAYISSCSCRSEAVFVILWGHSAIGDAPFTDNWPFTLWRTAVWSCDLETNPIHWNQYSRMQKVDCSGIQACSSSSCTYNRYNRLCTSLHPSLPPSLPTSMDV